MILLTSMKEPVKIKQRLCQLCNKKRVKLYCSSCHVGEYCSILCRSKDNECHQQICTSFFDNPFKNLTSSLCAQISNHWTNPINNKKNVRILQQVNEKQRSLVAKRLFLSGDCVLNESPLALVYSTEENHACALLSITLQNKLTAEHLRKCFFHKNLGSHKQSINEYDLGLLARLSQGYGISLFDTIFMYSICKLFGIPLKTQSSGRQVGTALYKLASLINHSCDPNCIVVLTATGNIHLYALRNVAPDEEITISYCPILTQLSLCSRFQELEICLGRSCWCSCCRDEALLLNSDHSEKRDIEHSGNRLTVLPMSQMRQNITMLLQNDSDVLPLGNLTIQLTIAVLAKTQELEPMEILVHMDYFLCWIASMSWTQFSWPKYVLLGLTCRVVRVVLDCVEQDDFIVRDEQKWTWWFRCWFACIALNSMITCSKLLSRCHWSGFSLLSKTIQQTRQTILFEIIHNKTVLATLAPTCLKFLSMLPQLLTNKPAYESWDDIYRDNQCFNNTNHIKQVLTNKPHSTITLGLDTRTEALLANCSFV